MFAERCPILITINIGPFFGNRHLCLCIWDTRQDQNVESTGINLTSQSIIMPKIKTFLPAVTTIWVQMDGRTDTQDQFNTSITTGIGPVMNNNMTVLQYKYMVLFSQDHIYTSHHGIRFSLLIPENQLDKSYGLKYTPVRAYIKVARTDKLFSQPIRLTSGEF